MIRGLSSGNEHEIYKHYTTLDFVFWLNRIALFIVFFWFGFLKIIHLSPAEQLVRDLHRHTIAGYIPFYQFQIILGAAECIIGILWLIPRLTKWAFTFFIVHMFTTFMPLVLLPGDTWRENFILTLTGQYIIKNLVLTACALTLLFGYFEKKNNQESINIL